MKAGGAGTRLGLLRRDRSPGWLGGVCAGIARRYGIDPALVRLAFVVATAAGGFGVALYALAWLVIPAGDAAEALPASEATDAGDAAPVVRTAAAISRTGIGIALVIAAGFAFLQATHALSAARDVILAVIAVIVVLGVIFAPWILRLV